MSLNFTSGSRVAGIAGYTGSSIDYDPYPIAHGTLPFLITVLPDSVVDPTAGLTSWFEVDGDGSPARIPQSLIAAHFGGKSFNIDITFENEDVSTALNVSETLSLGEGNNVSYEAIESIDEMYSLNARVFPTGHGEEGLEVDGGEPCLPHWTIRSRVDDGSDFLDLKILPEGFLGNDLRRFSYLTYSPQANKWIASSTFEISGRAGDAHIEPADEISEVDRSIQSIDFMGGTFYFTVESGTVTGSISVAEWLPVYDPLST